MTTLFDLDTNPDNNTVISGVTAAEGWSGRYVNNLLRALAGDIRGFLDLIGGVHTVAGSSTAYTIVTPATDMPTTLRTGLVVAFRPNVTCGDNPTLNVQAKGSKKLQRDGHANVVAGNLVANGVYLAIYDAAGDSASGAWVVVNPTPVAASVSYGSDDIANDSAESGATVSAVLDALGAEVGAITVGVSTAFDTLAEVETKFGLVDTAVAANATELDVVLPYGAISSLRLPRLTTTQRNALASPQIFDESYNTTTSQKEVYDGSEWGVPSGGDHRWDWLYSDVANRVGNWTQLATWTFSTGVTEVAFTSISGAYTDLLIVYSGLSPSAGAGVRLFTSSNNGSSYSGTAVAPSVIVPGTITGQVLISGYSETALTWSYFSKANNTDYDEMTTTQMIGTLGKAAGDTSAIDAVKLDLTTRTFDAGTITIYGSI